MTVPYTFATAITAIPLSQLDANFVAVSNSTNLNYNEGDTNAVTRTVQNKLAEIVSVQDFGAVSGGTSVNVTAFANAAAVANGRIITVPFANDATALPSDYSTTAFEYEAQNIVNNVALSYAKKSLKTEFPTPHTTGFWSAYNIEALSQGSTINGPSTADYGQTIYITKKGWGGVTDPVNGEIDGLSVYVRQDGIKNPSTANLASDASGILVNIQNVETCGYLSAIETASSNYNRTSSSITTAIGIQIGVIDSAQSLSYGYNALSNIGINTNAFYASNESGASWKNILNAPGCVLIDSYGNYSAFNSFFWGGVPTWSIGRANTLNSGTEFNHRGTGALYLNCAEAGAIQFGISNAAVWEINSNGHLGPVNNNVKNIGDPNARVANYFGYLINLGTTSTNGVNILSGAGSPNSSVTANVGSLFLRNDGGAGTTLYVKESGTGNTGWVAK